MVKGLIESSGANGRRKFVQLFTKAFHIITALKNHHNDDDVEDGHLCEHADDCDHDVEHDGDYVFFFLISTTQTHIQAAHREKTLHSIWVHSYKLVRTSTRTSNVSLAYAYPPSYFL